MGVEGWGWSGQDGGTVVLVWQIWIGDSVVITGGWDIGDECVMGWEELVVLCFFGDGIGGLWSIRMWPLCL